MKRKVTVVLIPAKEGGFVAYAPALGVTSQGETQEEAFAMAKDAIEGILAERHPDDLGALDVAYSPEAVLGSVEINVPTDSRVGITGG